MQMTTEQRRQFADLLAELVTARFGGSNKAAYTCAKVNSGTWKRLIDAETVKPTTLVTVCANLWPESGGAWSRVLSGSFGPSTDDASAAGGFVGAVGERVEGSRTDDDVLRAITAMSAAVDQLLASDRARTQRETARDRDVDARFEALETQQRELSERLAQLEKPHP